MYGVKILGTGSYLPDRLVTNDDMTKFVDTSDEWITSRSGIKSRYFAAPEQSTSDLALMAASRALESAALDPQELDLIILATYTPDRMNCSSACIVQQALGAKNAAAFDLSAACTGFIYGSSIASQFIKTGQYRKVLVVGSDTSSRILDFEDRTTCVLFGDGAGAVVYGRGPQNETAAVEEAVESQGLIYSQLNSDGSGADLLYTPAGGSRLPTSIETVEQKKHFLYMNGREIFKWSIRCVAEMMEKTLSDIGAVKQDIALVIPHQANIRIIEGIAKRFDLPLNKFYVNLDRYGNTVAGTIPIALDEVRRLKPVELKNGDLILMLGFGGGLTFGSLAYRVDWV